MAMLTIVSTRRKAKKCYRRSPGSVSIREFVRYPRQGHNIKERNYQIDLINRMAAWFEKYLT